MFETIEEAEIAIPFQVGEQALRAWSYVLQRLHTPWYHVTFVDSECERVAFCAHHKQFVGHPDVSSVQVVTPGWLNGTGLWRMDPLKQLWVADEPDADQEALIFVLGNEQRVVFSLAGSHEGSLREHEMIFQSKRH